MKQGYPVFLFFRIFPFSLILIPVLVGFFLAWQTHLFHQPDPDELKDILTIQERLREMLLSVDPQLLPRMESTLAYVLKTQMQDGSWVDIDYADQTRASWHPAKHLQRTAMLAQAYVTPGLNLYQNPLALDACHKGLEYWYRQNLRCPNWWWNQIYAPKQIGYTLLALGPHATDSQIRRGLQIMGRGRWYRMTGQNLAWTAGNQILRGCLARNSYLVEEAYRKLNAEIKIGGIGEEGIQADGSFHQHGAYLNSGSYGAGFSTNVTRFISAAWGTRFQPDEKQLTAFLSFLLDGQQWMIRHGMFDYSAIGREIVRERKTLTDPNYIPEGYFNEGLRAAISLLTRLPIPRQQEMVMFYQKLSPNPPPFSGNRHYWRSDYMVHHRPKWFASLRMHSTRTINSELVNGEGGTTHLLADGVTYYYLNGSEYRNIFPCWDWQKVPGVTAQQRPSLLPPDQGLAVLGPTEFVGGVSDGMDGVAVMDFKRESLQAKKAWFMFDEAVVCLGAGIQCDATHPVTTSVNQSLLQTEVLSSDSRIPLSTGTHTFAAPCWIHHATTLYLFPATGEVRLESFPRTGAWNDLGPGNKEPITQNVFNLYINHGSQPRSAQYCYVVLPAWDSANAPTTFVNPPFRVLANTPRIQAVLKPNPPIAGIAFHQPGIIYTSDGWHIEADRPCLALIRETTQGLSVSVANPMNQPLEVNLRIRYRNRSGKKQDLTLLFDLPDGILAGSTQTQVVKNSWEL